MPYSPPKGFVSAEILAGFPVFYGKPRDVGLTLQRLHFTPATPTRAGTVRHWANQHEWTDLCDSTDGRCFGNAGEYLKMRTSTTGEYEWKEYQQWVYGEQVRRA